MRQLRATRRRRERRDEQVPDEARPVTRSAREDLDERCAAVLGHIDEALGAT